MTKTVINDLGNLFVKVDLDSFRFKKISLNYLLSRIIINIFYNKVITTSIL